MVLAVKTVLVHVQSPSRTGTYFLLSKTQTLLPINNLLCLEKTLKSPCCGVGPTPLKDIWRVVNALFKGAGHYFLTPRISQGQGSYMQFDSTMLQRKAK